jgi:hypothetical protein
LLLRSASRERRAEMAFEWRREGDISDRRVVCRMEVVAAVRRVWRREAWVTGEEGR